MTSYPHTISKLKQQYANHTKDPEDIILGYFNSIREKDPLLHSYISVHEKEAIESIKSLNKVEPLYGIPLAIKDNILVKNLPCTAASKILEGFIAPYDATVIGKIRKAGGIILGKTNMDEFAMGSSTENSYFFPTRNPYDTSCVPGGSSGGSTAAVSADLALIALGTDTGGSIRQPAAFCGVVGIRPTYGLVSRYGLIAFASSLDQIGPIGQNVDDAFLLLSIISGYDPMDSTSLEMEYDELPCNTNIQSFSIIHEIENLQMDPEIKQKYEEVKIHLSKQFHCTENHIKSFKYALPAYHVIADAEASSNLSRFDGLRYGLRIDKDNWRETSIESRTKGFGREVKRRILLGTFTLSAGFKEAYYAKAFLARESITKEFADIFKKNDFILTPTTTTLPFRFGEKMDPLQMYQSDICTIPSALAGIPSVSIPVGLSTMGLPIGMQIIGENFSEKNLHKIAKLIEGLLI